MRCAPSEEPSAGKTSAVHETTAADTAVRRIINRSRIDREALAHELVATQVPKLNDEKTTIPAHRMRKDAAASSPICDWRSSSCTPKHPKMPAPPVKAHGNSSLRVSWKSCTMSCTSVFATAGAAGPAATPPSSASTALMSLSGAGATLLPAITVAHRPRQLRGLSRPRAAVWMRLGPGNVARK